MDSYIVEALKFLVNLILLPIIGFGGFLLRKHVTRIDELDKRVLELEKDLAVMESQLQDIKCDIVEIKNGINKLVDRLCR